MLPLDPVKELVQVTRVKFHNPSMAFRICQLNKTNQSKRTNKKNPNQNKPKPKTKTSVPGSLRKKHLS